MNITQAIASLKEAQTRLERIIHRKEVALDRAPNGSVLVKRKRGGAQFFYRDDPKDRNGTYMPKAERKRAIALIQKRYDKRLLDAARKQKRAIDAFLNAYDPYALREVFDREGDLRQLFIDPTELPDAQYIRMWEAHDYDRKPFREDAPVHYTQKQERVRSKSEVLIANALHHDRIPYRYECPLKLGNQIIHPDFTILRMSDRKEIYWEHLGMMDDSEYRNHAFRRIREYERQGIFPGDRLIITAETLRMPLNANVVEDTIKHHLKY